MPGTFVEVQLFLGEPEQAFKLPITALVYSANRTFVYKVVDGKAVATDITVKHRGEKDVVIEGDIKAGDTIITVGQIKVRDGAPIMVSK